MSSSSDVDSLSVFKMCMFSALAILLTVAMLPGLYDYGMAAYHRNAPLEKTEVVSLNPRLVELMRKSGVQDFKAQPAASGARKVFVLAVNGEVGEQPYYSDITYPDRMYRVALTKAGTEVYLSKDGKKDLSPAEYRRVIENDAIRYLEMVQLRKEKTAQLNKWD